jgi:hypothetical protein
MMNSNVESAFDPFDDQRLSALIQEKQRLEHTIEVTWQIVQSTQRTSVATAERLKGRPLSFEEQAGTIASRDRAFLDSLHINLELVNKQIESLTPSSSS